MERCSKCHRAHSGICGIPAGVTLKFGARIGGIGIGSTGTRKSSSNTSSWPAHTVPKAKLSKTWLKKRGLEEMLDWGLEQEKKCMGMLKLLPAALPEYDEILGKLAKVQDVIVQIRQQIAVRK